MQFISTAWAREESMEGGAVVARGVHVLTSPPPGPPRPRPFPPKPVSLPPPHPVPVPPPVRPLPPAAGRRTIVRAPRDEAGAKRATLN
jgi:hypothetical protein